MTFHIVHTVKVRRLYGPATLTKYRTQVPGDGSLKRRKGGGGSSHIWSWQPVERVEAETCVLHQYGASNLCMRLSVMLLLFPHPTSYRYVRKSPG